MLVLRRTERYARFPLNAKLLNSYVYTSVKGQTGCLHIHRVKQEAISLCSVFNYWTIIESQGKQYLLVPTFSRVIWIWQCFCTIIALIKRPGYLTSSLFIKITKSLFTLSTFLLIYLHFFKRALRKRNRINQLDLAKEFSKGQSDQEGFKKMFIPKIIKGKIYSINPLSLLEVLFYSTTRQSLNLKFCTSY